MIRSKNSSVYYQRTVSPTDYYPVSATTTYRASPDIFKPSKRGLNIASPDVAPTDKNANAYLLNNGASPRDPASVRKLYLWVDSITTGWSLSGETSQVSGSRSFYPKNLQQEQLTITGTMPNQYQYDMLVRFVERAHWTALNGGMPLNQNWNGFIDFLLYRPTGGRTFDYFQKSHLGSPLINGIRAAANLGILIENIQAGHERFQFAPAFTLTCRVIDDRTDKNRDNLYNRMMDSISLTSVFGDIDPTPYVAESSDDITSTVQKNGNLQKKITSGADDIASSVQGFFSS